MMSQPKFDQLVALCRAIEFKENSRQGTLTVADDTQRDLITGIISADNDEYGLKVLSGNVDALQSAEC